MKEKIKLFLVIMISVVISSTISITATTLLQANQVSYKTSNGDTTDVNSALDRLFDAADINGRLGNTDIGNKTITQAISDLSSNTSCRYNDESKYIQFFSDGEWYNYKKLDSTALVIFEKNSPSLSGWDSFTYVSQTFSYSAGNGYHFYANSTTNYSAYFWSTAPIDISNYNTMEVDVEITTMSGGNWPYVYAGINTSLPSNTTDPSGNYVAFSKRN